MKLENSFTIPVPAEDAWRVLLDVERIAPCVPGAAITSRDGDNYGGTMKVKLGPVSMTYNGTLRIRSQDEVARVAVIEGGARESRGNGTAQAVVTCRLVENEHATEVFVETDLNITGKPAQFGRGVFAEVAGTLIGQFAANLAVEITASVPDQAPAAAPAVDPLATRQAAEPIDLLDAAGIGRVKWIGLPVVAVVLFAIYLIRRSRWHCPSLRSPRRDKPQ